MESSPDLHPSPFGPGADAHGNGRFNPIAAYNDPSFLSKILGTEIKTMPPKDIRREAEERSSKIFESYDTLHQILARHEATIRRRWAKKNRQQKLKVVLSAWPNMPAVHRPDFDAFRKQAGRITNIRTKYKEDFMWPHINQDDLSQPKTLPLLLNARGRHHPSEFSGADYAAMHFGHVTKVIVPVFLNEYTMILDGARDALDYGRLVSWDDHPEAFEWMHSRKQYMPGEGLLVLEAQEKILAFLVQCCKLILHDIPANTLTTDAFPILPEPALYPKGQAGGFNYLTLMAAEAPYRVPANINLARIESLLGARKSAAEDHIWALREDPNYFTEQLLDAREHRLEIVKDVDGNVHPSLKPGRELAFWARVLGDVLLSAYIQLEIFSELHQQASDLQNLQMKYHGSISPSEALPNEYLLPILRFRHYVEQAAKGPLARLKTGAPASPPLRKYFVRVPPENNTSPQVVVRSKPYVKSTKLEEHLMWLLRTLWEDGYALFLASMPLVLDELERLLQVEQSASALVSGRIAAEIGDLSIIAQCTNQIDLFLPWARSFETIALEHEEDLNKEYTERTRPWASMMNAVQNNRFPKLAILADPTDKKFFYPVERRRSKENVLALRQAESNLDDFWAVIDRHMYAECGTLDGSAVQRLLSQPRVLQRTPDWIEKLPVATHKQEQQPDTRSGSETLFKPLSTLYFGLTADEPRTSGEKQKCKIKTRGTPQEQEIEQEVKQVGDVISEVDANRQPTISVDARSLKVFRTVFFNPETTSTPGEIAWTEFIHAMTSTGLFSAEKLYGSVWQFQRSDGLGRIQFHEPHPRNKIPFTIARRHGRRLNRAFGWVGEMFKLK